MELENQRLRAALAMSDQPCAYCSLPADKWAECAHGFPGCGRGDDAMGCPYLGHAMAYATLLQELDEISAQLDHVRTLIGNARGQDARTFPAPRTAPEPDDGADF